MKKMALLFFLLFLFSFKPKPKKLHYYISERGYLYLGKTKVDLPKDLLLDSIASCNGKQAVCFQPEIIDSNAIVFNSLRIDIAGFRQNTLSILYRQRQYWVLGKSYPYKMDTAGKVIKGTYIIRVEPDKDSLLGHYVQIAPIPNNVKGLNLK